MSVQYVNHLKMASILAETSSDVLRGARDINSRSAGQETPPPFMESEDSLPCSQEQALVPIVSHINPIHTLYDIYSTHTNIILPYTPKSPKRSLPSRFSNQYFVRSCHFPMRAISPAHLILKQEVTNIKQVTQ
jgi:hypothetical protein